LGGPFSIAFLAAMEYVFLSTDAAGRMNTVALVLAFLLWLLWPSPAPPGAGTGNRLTLSPGSPAPLPQHGEPRAQYRTVFEILRRGLEAGNVALFQSYLAPQVQLDLRGGESGYYSAPQAYYLLDSYFRTRRLANLRFSTIGESELNPFATGGAGISYKGSRELVQVYVALTLAGDRWVVSRINIY
jgi:hypothetical protein